MKKSKTLPSLLLSLVLFLNFFTFCPPAKAVDLSSFTPLQLGYALMIANGYIIMPDGHIFFFCAGFPNSAATISVQSSYYQDILNYLTARFGRFDLGNGSTGFNGITISSNGTCIIEPGTLGKYTPLPKSLGCPTPIRYPDITINSGIAAGDASTPLAVPPAPPTGSPLVVATGQGSTPLAVPPNAPLQVVANATAGGGTAVVVGMKYLGCGSAMAAGTGVTAVTMIAGTGVYTGYVYLYLIPNLNNQAAQMSAQMGFTPDQIAEEQAAYEKAVYEAQGNWFQNYLTTTKNIWSGNW